MQENFSAENISIKEASRILKKSEQFIRIGLQEKFLPIGIAFKRDGSTHYSYYISPKMLYEFTGYRKDVDESNYIDGVVNGKR